MKFVDSIELKIIGGKGGDGAVAFRRELYVPKGGPAGGDGGKGGDVIFIAKNNVNTLFELKNKKIIKADDGTNGQHKNMHGKNAEDKYVCVPVGTLITNQKTNEIMCDLSTENKKYVIAYGGKGGRGNSRFANSKNKAPTIFECGDLGQQIFIKCELKLLADVGFVGLPNAGKSTLLSVLTMAKPQISNYEFTTINPQLGVCKDKNNNSFVIADLPGLIEGASSGKGLGHIFLKHIERCRIIVHVIDISSNYTIDKYIYKKYEIILKELKQYNLDLLKKQQLIVLNKIDTKTSEENIKYFKKKIKNVNIIEISALKKINLENLKIEISNLLTKIQKPQLTSDESNNTLIKNHIIYEYVNKKTDEFKIININKNKWKIEGEAIFRIYHKYPPTTHDNLLMFNNILKKIGVFNELRKRQAKQGDIIQIYDLEMEWND